MIDLIILTVTVIVLAERITDKIVPMVFKRQFNEILRDEQKLTEMNEISALALIANDKEAYRGLQDEMNELYAKIFFKKIAIYSSVFFGLISAYILLAVYISSRSYTTVGQILLIVMIYYTIKAIYYYFFILLR